MRIVVINGTEVKGCTYHMKELFLNALREDNEIREFYLPRDMPGFCTGCKLCFIENELACPHSEYTMPIWNEMLEADLIVFAYPVYVLRTPGQVKALLDHFGCHWMVHRPDKRMFSKNAVIITQSIGSSNKAAQKDVAASLTWMGISSIKKIGFKTMGSIKWEEISDKRRKRIEDRIIKFSKECMPSHPARKKMNVKILFLISKMLHKNLLKNEEVPSADNQHWIDNGWI